MTINPRIIHSTIFLYFKSFYEASSASLVHNPMSRVVVPLSFYNISCSEYEKVIHFKKTRAVRRVLWSKLANLGFIPSRV